MTIEEGFVWFSLATFIAAYVINRQAMKLLDEAKVHADRWETEREAAEALRAEAIIIFDNAQRTKAVTDKVAKMPERKRA